MTKKNIFSQLFSSTILLILACFFLVGTMLYGLIGSYLSREKAKDLTALADNLAEFTVNMAKQDPYYAKKNYQMNIDVLSRSAEAHITVLNTKGEIIAETSYDPSVSIKKDFYKSVLEGRRVHYTGTLGGAFKSTTLTVGVPILHNRNSVFGGIFISMPIPEIHHFRTAVIQIFFLSAILIFLVALAVTYLMSTRITKPLKRLKKAAVAIADGQLSQRVDLKAGNEIDDLGEAFNKMADSLEQLENMRSSFIANVSHDLRTPMTTISGFVEGILDGTIPPENQERYLSIVLDETKRLSRLVTDLLELSKSEQNPETLELREFDINEMVRLTIIKLEKRLEKKNIRLTVNFSQDPQRVLADKDGIQRVLTNLMDNALKFTENGGFIDLATGEAEKGKVFVSVQNSGSGIKREDLIHIFDRFYKTDKSRSMDKNGTGLGLYIAKTIISAHGEKIWAESTPGEFTRFHFTLKSAPPQARD